MAKYGEGDRRWIVEDRADGANVHNWHWSEKDCIEWTRKRLAELLENVTILDGAGGLWIRTTKLESVTGEAYVNIRKGKIISGYEIAVKLCWKGEAKDGSGNSIATADGKVELPYIADENADEDPELKVSVLDETPVGQRLREAFLATGKAIILERVAKYVAEMASGGPAREELDSKGNLKAKNVPSQSKETFVAASEQKQAPPPPPEKKKRGMRTISLIEKFHCRPHDIYYTLLDENRWKGFTQSNAKIRKEVGGEFIIFDGAVKGVILKLEEDKLIMQKWRFESWNDGHFSTVTMTFEEPEIGVTILKLTQTDVPEEDRFGNASVVENTEMGWQNHIFHKIRAVFGYGL